MLARALGKNPQSTLVEKRLIDLRVFLSWEKKGWLSEELDLLDCSLLAYAFSLRVLNFRYRIVSQEWIGKRWH